MRWSRLVGLVVSVLIVLWALGSVAQLGESLFDHGGMLPTLVLLVAVLILTWRLGVGVDGPARTTYW